MKLDFIENGLFKLDGGAMFGVVPKKMWNKLNPSDENNMCTWSTRSLLIQTGDRKILVDTGLGNKQDEKFMSYFEPHGTGSIDKSLSAIGLKKTDITDVFLTHLHFDHVGGALGKTKEGHYFPNFENARYWTNEIHLKWALNPNPREKASFLKENFVPLQGEGVLDFIDIKSTHKPFNWIPGIDIQLVYGHTEAMMILHLKIGEKRLIYTADLIPSSYHVGMPYVMAYDLRPLEVLKEKKNLYDHILGTDTLLLFEHDPKNSSCTIKKNEKGRIVIDELLSIPDFLKKEFVS